MRLATAAILTAAAIGTLAAATTPAHAESVPYGYYGEAEPARPKDPWKRARFEGAVGALVGSQRIGYISGTGGGLHLDLGVRLDRLMVYGEYDFLSVGETSIDEPEPVRGFMHRFGANVRWSFAAVGGGNGEVPVRGDFWVEAGAGQEEIRWHEGGRLGRRDLAFGLGGQATFRIGRHNPKPKFLGIYYAVKVWIADSPERKDDEPTCAGPCDEATGPSPWDFGVYFNFGVPFGR